MTLPSTATAPTPLSIETSVAPVVVQLKVVVWPAVIVAGLAARLSTVGGAGLTPTVLTELDDALEHHELIKVRLRVGDRDKRDAVLGELLERSRAILTQRVGNVALLYREAEKPKLKLPAS